VLRWLADAGVSGVVRETVTVAAREVEHVNSSAACSRAPSASSLRPRALLEWLGCP
jgi:hypothetical protein